MKKSSSWLASLAAIALVLCGVTPLAAQVSPEEHASHHPDQAAGGAQAGADEPAAEPGGGMMGGKGGGGMGGKGGMGDMMKNMGVPPPKELYPSLMELPDLPLEKRAEVQEQAHTRMKQGTALLATSLERLSRAAPGDDYRAMQAALGEMREGVAQLESGIAAHLALKEGSAPRNVALRWFKKDMGLLPPTPGAASGQVLGLSAFHFFSMLALIAFAAAVIWLYFHKMRRAQELLRALAVQAPPSSAPVPPESKVVAPASTNPAPAAPKPASSAAPAPTRAAVGSSWSGELKVARIFQETHDIKTFRFMASDEGPIPFSYLPGQFLTLSLELEGKNVKRSYTIASSPTVQDYLEITVKREEQGLVSRHLHDTVREGDELTIKAPGGRLTFTGEGAEGIVLIGGGVGITPMMSVIRYLTDRGWAGAIHFIYSCKTTRDFVFREELEYLQRRHPNLNVMATMTREEGTVWMGLKGRLTREVIAAAVVDIKTSPIHICGPPPMMEAIKQMLEALGVPKQHIRLEAFGSAKQPKAKTPSTSSAPESSAPSTATATFKASGKSGPLRADETVLDVAEALEVDIESSCRSGACGMCAVKLLEGQVEMETEDGLDPEQKAAGYILACQAKSDAAVVVDA